MIRNVQKQRMVLSAAWTAERVQAFLGAACDEPLYPAFLLLSLYGLRRGEVLGLRWCDIDFASRTIHVRQQLQRYDSELHLSPVKTNAGLRDLPLLAVVEEALRNRRNPDHAAADDGLLFRTKFDNPIEGGNLLRAFRRIGKAAGLLPITLHHLRHTAATLLKNAGIPARDAQLILGHAAIATTQQLYQHADLVGHYASTRTTPAAAAASWRRWLA